MEEEEKKVPFLTFITRTYKRPNLLLINKNSLAKQNDKDFVQMILEDKKGIGVPKANSRLSKVEVESEYVYIFDDDEEITSENFVATIKKVARQKDWLPLSNPDVIIIPAERVSTVIGIHHDLKLGNVGTPNIIVKKVYGMNIKNTGVKGTKVIGTSSKNF